MQCISCGFENVPGMSTCVRCQSPLDLSSVDVHPPRRGSGWASRAMNRLRAMAQRRHSLRPLIQPLLVPAYGRVMWSILPGLGQILYRQRWLGSGLLCAWLLAVAFSLLRAGTSSGALAFAATISIHSLAVGLAMAPLLTRTHLAKRLGIGVASFLVLLAAYDLLRNQTGRFAQATEINNILPCPQLTNGDVLLHNSRSLRFQSGELVVYRMPHGLGVDRINAVAGQRLSITAGALVIDGQPADQNVMPLGDIKNMRDVATIEAGPDEVLIVPSLLKLYAAHNADATVIQRVLSAGIRVKKSDIVGHVFWRTYPLERFGKME